MNDKVLNNVPRELLERCLDRWACCSMAQVPGAEQAWNELRAMLAAAPAQPAAHDQGEVQRLREALELLRVELDIDDNLRTVRLVSQIDATLAASTGQEQKENKDE